VELVMSRKKHRTLYQHRFNLSSEDPNQQLLHDFLLMLAVDGSATKWIVGRLVAEMPRSRTPASTPYRQQPATVKQAAKSAVKSPSFKVAVADDDDPGDEVTYEDLEE
jgi:hypothetical protein